ncbi:hypothetical protein TB2_030593 [Malus domestica]
MTSDDDGGGAVHVSFCSIPVETQQAEAPSWRPPELALVREDRVFEPSMVESCIGRLRSDDDSWTALPMAR